MHVDILHISIFYIYVTFVDHRGRVFCAKLLQKPLGMLTHL